MTNHFDHSPRGDFDREWDRYSRRANKRANKSATSFGLIAVSTFIVAVVILGAIGWGFIQLVQFFIS